MANLRRIGALACAAIIGLLVIGTLFGLTSLPIGVVGHEGSTLVVVGNALRLLNVRARREPKISSDGHD